MTYLPEMYFILSILRFTSWSLSAGKLSLQLVNLRIRLYEIHFG